MLIVDRDRPIVGVEEPDLPVVAAQAAERFSVEGVLAEGLLAELARHGRRRGFSGLDVAADSVESTRLPRGAIL